MTHRYAVIGNPVAHSRSPQIHTAFARQTGEALEYTRIEAPIDGFREVASGYFAAGGSGLSVTVPFKSEALAMAADATARARLAGAANVLAVQPDGGLLADNTDGIGLIRDLTLNLGVGLTGRRILLLGAGGAARGVIGPLLAESPAALFVANRNGDRSASLATHFALAGPLDGGGFDEIEGAWDIIINATSAGLKAADPLPIDPAALPAPRAVYDMIYNPAETALLAAARARGLPVANGLSMLVHQGARALEIWSGASVPVATMAAAARAAMGR